MPFYVLDENNNRVEAYSKEEVLAVLQQAIEDGTLDNIIADSAFVTKLKCCVSGTTMELAFVSQATYNDLEKNNQVKDNCYYFILDDTTCEDIDKSLEEINEQITSILSSIAKMPRRIFTNPQGWVGVSGVSSVDVTDYVGDPKGFFRVTMKTGTGAQFVICDLLAAYDSFADVHFRNDGVVAECYLSGNEIVAETGTIMAVDYYKAA